MSVFAVDWRALFAPTVGLAELFIRGSAMYLGILVAMRVLRRQKGGTSTADLLVLVVVADAAQNAMSAEYHSLTEGFLLVATIFFWDYVLDLLSFRSKLFRKLLTEPPLELVVNGQLQRNNMRREMFTREDILAQLREQGIEDLACVKQMCLESSGHFSVIKTSGDSVQAPKHDVGVN